MYDDKKLVLILDNAKIHKTEEVKETLIGTGFKVLFLPPYTPQFNPIELVFNDACYQRGGIVETMLASFDDNRERDNLKDSEGPASHAFTSSSRVVSVSASPFCLVFPQHHRQQQHPNL